MRMPLVRSLATFSLVALAAFAHPAAAEAPRHGGTLTVALQPEPVVLTSAVNPAQATSIVAANVFDGLLEYDTDLKPRPSLATAWALSPDGTVLTLRLREGVTWHDGTPFTSADVKWTAENVWTKLHPRLKAVFGPLVSAETPDAHTIVFRFSQPSPVVLSALSSFGAPLLPKHLYEGTDILNNPYNNKPVGTGAFVFKEWKKGEYLVLERNPSYWDKDKTGTKPYLDKIIFRIILDASARAAALEKGEAQYAVFNPVPLRDVERLEKQGALKFETGGYSWLAPWLFADLNLDNPYLKDVRVRRAIAHAIDKANFAKVVWYGFAKPAVSPVSSKITTFHDADVPKYAFDLARANALLDEAGFKRGPDGTRFALNLDYLPYGDDFKRSGEYIRQALKRVGIEVNVRGEDTAAFLRRIYTQRDFDISLVWLAGFADPQLGVPRVYVSDTAGKGIPWTNASGYNNPDIDALVKRIQSEGNAAERVKLFKAFQQTVLTDVPSIPLLELENVTVHAARLEDVVTSADQVYGSLKNVWFDAK